MAQRESEQSNITDWKTRLSDPSCTQLTSTWECYKSYVALCLKLGSPGLWVDLGCGLAHFVECCERFGIRCEGLEGDKYAVEQAKKRYPALIVKQYNIIEKLPYDDESVSVVFCNQVLEHLPPDSTNYFLTEIRRILKTGGMLFLNSPSKFAPGPNGKDHPDHINLLTPSELNQALLRAGFNDIWPANYPFFIFGNSIVGKALIGSLFFLFPFDRLSNTATAICFVGSQPEGKIRSPRYFHIKRLLGW